MIDEQIKELEKKMAQPLAGPRTVYLGDEEIKEQDKKMAKLFARAWSDESFKERFISNPRSVLKEYDIFVPAAVEIKVLEQTDAVMHIVLPLKPGEEWSIKPIMTEDTDEISCVRCV